MNGWEIRYLRVTDQVEKNVKGTVSVSEAVD